jgi:lysophospholipid acyltransferase (LPLAT)-like uncharacterized protein
MSLWRDKLVPALAPRVAYLYILLLRATMRLEYDNREALRRSRREFGHYILSFWHSRFVMMPYVCLDRRMVALISRSRDSRMLGLILGQLGFTLAWGSSSTGGARALREVLRKVEEGYDVAITPDGPRGPRRRAKPGVIAAARLTGLPIVPVGFSARPARRLASWDRTLVPYPFARGLYVCGEPMIVARDVGEAEQERLRLLLEAEVDRLTDLADTRVGLGVEDVRPPVEA